MQKLPARGPYDHGGEPVRSVAVIPQADTERIDIEMSVGPEAFSNAPSIGLDITH